MVTRSPTELKLVEWAEGEEDIRAMLLVGSRGEIDGYPDGLSDYDAVLFCRDRLRYESTESWLSIFGTILVKLDEQYEVLGTTVATRLVQYDDGSRIDFSISEVGLLERMTEGAHLPDLLDAGFLVLVDKDGWVSRLPRATGTAYRENVPSEASYRSLVNEFWWEATVVAKYLARAEIFPAVYSHECVIRFRCLLPMMEWYARTVHRVEGRVWEYGRRLTRKLEAREVAQLGRTFLGSSIEESWDALFETTRLFRVVSRKVADSLGYGAEEESGERVESLLRAMRDRGSGMP